MRGSPLIRALIAFFAILLLGFPLRELTRPETAGAGEQTPAPEVEVVKASVIRLQLTFTTLPTSVRVLHLGNEVWKAAPTAPEVEQELSIPFPPDGVDLQFEIAWPEEGTSAMRAVLTDPEGTEHTKSIWGSGSVTDVLTFP